MTDNTDIDLNEYYDVLTTEEALVSEPVQLELFDNELLEF
jgi:hypothetical protein